MGKGSAPSAPDPYASAAAQYQYGTQAADYSKGLNATNVVTPTGSTTWSQSPAGVPTAGGAPTGPAPSAASQLPGGTTGGGAVAPNGQAYNLAPGTSLGSAVTTIEETMSRIGVPATIRGSFQGAAKIFQESLSSEPYLILAAFATIYISLGMLYESFVHPLTILSTLPSAGVGAVLALMLFHTQFDIIAMIGVILLIGIVKKNAIMMIDFALDAERMRGLSPADAILGAVPLALSFGNGSEIRRPLGISIMGGLVISQLLTLYTTPVLYLYMDRLGSWSLRQRQRLLPGLYGSAPAE